MNFEGFTKIVQSYTSIFGGYARQNIRVGSRGYDQPFQGNLRGEYPPNVAFWNRHLK